MIAAEWLTKQFKDGQQSFLDWLGNYVVDHASGRLPWNTTRGFPLPERDADALSYEPGDENPYHSPMQLEAWQEHDVVLAILQIGDNVTGDDIFTWYRVPVCDIPLTRKE